MRRVLAPGGRAAVAVLRGLRHSPAYAPLADALEKHVAAEAGAMLRSIFPSWTRDEVRALVREAGFRDLRVRSEVGSIRYPSAEEFLRQEAACSPLAGVLRAMPDAARDALVRGSRRQHSAPTRTTTGSSRRWRPGSCSRAPEPARPRSAARVGRFRLDARAASRPRGRRGSPRAARPSACPPVLPRAHAHRLGREGLARGRPSARTSSSSASVVTRMSRSRRGAPPRNPFVYQVLCLRKARIASALAEPGRRAAARARA